MKLIATSKLQQNHAVMDPWTLVHFALGLSAGLMNLGFWKSMAAAATYEIAEHVFERTQTGKSMFVSSGPESVPNVVMDLGVFGLGHWLGTRWNDTTERNSTEVLHEGQAARQGNSERRSVS